MKRYSANMQRNYKRTPVPKCEYSNVALQLYWNHISVSLFSCKFAAYFQSTFSEEHLWRTASQDSHKAIIVWLFVILIFWKPGPPLYLLGNLTKNSTLQNKKNVLKVSWRFQFTVNAKCSCVHKLRKC